MSATVEDRIYRYMDKDHVKEVLRWNGLGAADASYLSAVPLPTGVLEIAGVATVNVLATRSCKLFYISDGPTGFFQHTVGPRIVFINESDMVDYSLVSALHTTPDAEVYLAMTKPWEAGKEVAFELHQEWYRDESFPDEYKED